VDKDSNERGIFIRGKVREGMSLQEARNLWVDKQYQQVCKEMSMNLPSPKDFVPDERSNFIRDKIREGMKRQDAIILWDKQEGRKMIEKETKAGNTVNEKSEENRPEKKKLYIPSSIKIFVSNIKITHLMITIFFLLVINLIYMLYKSNSFNIDNNSKIEIIEDNYAEIRAKVFVIEKTHEYMDESILKEGIHDLNNQGVFIEDLDNDFENIKFYKNKNIFKPYFDFIK
jgi:hypothetical protein